MDHQLCASPARGSGYTVGTRCSPHRTRSLGTLPPGPCVQHTLCSALDCCILRSILYPYLPAQILNCLWAKRTSFLNLFMCPPIPALPQQAPWECQGCTRYFRDQLLKCSEPATVPRAGLDPQQAAGSSTGFSLNEFLGNY